MATCVAINRHHASVSGGCGGCVNHDNHQMQCIPDMTDSWLPSSQQGTDTRHDVNVICLRRAFGWKNGSVQRLLALGHQGLKLKKKQVGHTPCNSSNFKHQTQHLRKIVQHCESGLTRHIRLLNTATCSTTSLRSQSIIARAATANTNTHS